MSAKTKILIVEHDPNDIELIQYELKKGNVNYIAEIVETGNAYENALRNFVPDIILSDYYLPSFDGPAAFEIKEKISPHTPFIFVSGTVGEENSIELIKNGVTDFVLKDKLFTLTTKVNRALKESKENQLKIKTEQALAESENHLRIILQTDPECIKLLGINGELEDINPAGLAMIEADNMEQVKGKSVLGIIDEPYRKAFDQLIQNVFKGKSGKLEFEITGLKGTHRWLETHAVPLKGAEGKIISLLGVTRDITERKKAAEEIKNTTEQLRQLTSHLQKVREEERKRIGREIHDELGQQLTAIKMDIVWIDKKTPEETIAVKSKLKNIITLLDESNLSVRKILNELRPGILDDHGLLEALQWHGQQFTANTGIPVEFTTAETEVKLSEPIAICIFRVYQESLTNITRYAGANKVLTSLSINDDNIIVTIEDDGKGFDITSVKNKKSFGILGMKERIRSLDGKFELVSSPGKGTKIIITIPRKT